MTPAFNSDYDSTKYVHRKPIEDDLLQLLLKVPAIPRDRRSMIVESSASSGKTWLLEYIIEQCTSYPRKPIVLSVSLTDFNQPFNHKTPDTLFLPLVQRLYDEMLNYDNQLKQYFAYPKNNHAVIKDCLGITANHLSGLSNPPLILIIFDGIEEIIEFSLENYQKSILSRQNLLWRFEDIFLTPLLKYPNVRILSSRRSKEAHWKPYNNKKLTKEYPLPDFSQQDKQTTQNSAAMQFDRMIHPSVGITFNDIQAELPLYDWNHPGTNTLLFGHAHNNGASFSRNILEDCFQTLTRSALGFELITRDRVWLNTLLESNLHHAVTPLTESVLIELATINSMLNIDESTRREFLNRLQQRGIGVTQFPYFVIHPEVCAIYRELQRR